MGKSYKQEKSFKPKPKRLHTHRDLPDITDSDPYDDSPPFEELENAKTIRPVQQPNKQTKD